MTILYIFLTILMVLDCVLLCFLVLLQLPKKEAGAGVAFGGAATDALFGAGSGNVLTKITKYVAVIFFGLAVIMALMASQLTKNSSTASFGQKLTEKGTTPASPVTPPSSSAPLAVPNNGLLQLTNATQPAPSPAAPAPAKKTNQ